MTALRHTCVLLLLFTGFAASLSAQFSITGYELLRETRVSRTLFEYEYRVTASNGGAQPAFQVEAVAASQSPALTIVQGAANFSRVNAGQSAHSANTILFRFDRLTEWSDALLEWSFHTGQPPLPVANAGLNQTVTIGSTVTLNGSGSSDPSGLPLTFSWEISTRPSGSTTPLNDPSAVSPSFLADAVGTYVLTLRVNNGFLDSAPSQVTISTEAVPPSANAGPDRTINITTPTPVAMLDGSGSSSPGDLPLTYAWSFVSRPAGSNAALNDPAAVMPSFEIDQVGEYELQLVVNNGFFDSAPGTVRVTASNAVPTANAGADQSANAGQTVQLNGSGSSDPNSLPLTFQWSFTTRPAGSAAVLSDAAAVNPTFALDVVGTYVVQLIVNNGFQASAADTVTISTDLLAPTANAGPDQQVPLNTLVTLDGSGSTDPNGLALVYNWSLIHVPDGSAATLSNPAIVSPTFTADGSGEYVAQLIVNNGTLPSTPDTVTITTNSLPPAAHAGEDQQVTAGQLVLLDGRDSAASSGLPLSYLWNFVTRPAGSEAALIDAATATPRFTPDAPGMYVVQLIVNDTLLDSEADTVVINAVPAGQITLTAPGVVRTYKTVDVDITLSNPAPVGGLLVGLVSAGGLSAPANVMVPEGATGASFPLPSGTQAGDFAITGSAPGWVQDAVTITVELRPLQFVIDEELIATNQTVPGRLVFDEPVPAGGVTFSVSSNNVPVASPIPTALLVAEGAIEAAVDVDGGIVGVATITATAPGYATANDSLAVTNRSVLLAEDVKVGVGQTLPFNVGISEAAPANVTVTLSGFDPAVVSVTPTQVTIPQGATQASVQPQVTGIGFGVTTITGTAPGHITDSEEVATTLTVTFSPSVASIVETNTREVTVNLSAPAPAGGLTLNLRSDDEAVATLPATVSFAPNTSTADVVISGEAPGTTTIRAGAPNITDGTLAVTVTEAPGFNLQLQTIGRDLQQQGSVILQQAAPAGNLQVTLTSDDPARLLFSLDRTGAGSASVTVQVNAGSTSPSQPVYYQALDGSGSVTYAVTAPGYKRSTGTVNLTPSGLAFVDTLTTLRTTYSTTLQAGEQQLGLRPMRLAPGSFTFTAPQALRGGFVLPVTLQSSDPPVGTVPETLNLELATASFEIHRFPFTPVAAGETTLTVTPPPGWSVPAQYPSLVVTVTSASLDFYQLRDTVVGRDLQTFASNVVLDAPAAQGGLTVTLQTDSPSLLLAKNGSSIGSQSISFTVAEGGTSVGGPVYIQALESSGTVNITMSAPGYQTNTVPIALAPSGMTISLQTSVNANTLTNLNLRGVAYRLNPATGATAGSQQIRGGFTLTTGLTSSQPAVGTVPAEVSATGNGNATGPEFVFTPLAEGSTELTVTQPTGWQTPSNWSSLTVNVSAPGMSLLGTVVGKDLQNQAQVTLAAPAPQGGTTVTVTSQSPDLLLSTVRTAVGASSITLDVPAGQSATPFFYVQALGSSGQPTVTFTAPRYASGSTQYELRPSAVAFNTNSFSTTTISGNQVLTVGTYPLFNYPSNQFISPSEAREVRGGITLSVPIVSSDPAVGAITTPLPLQIVGGTSELTQFNFLPASAGTTTLSITQPPGFLEPANLSDLPITVTAPAINVGNGRWRVGSQLQRQIPLGLQVPAPPGGVTVTLTSGNPNLLLSTSPDTLGTNSITVTIPQGASSGGSFYVQSLAAAGQATVNVSAPGFQTTNAVFELVPSALTMDGAAIDFPASLSSIVMNVRVAQLNPATLNVDTDGFLQPSLRAGFSVTTDIANSNPAVATVTSPITLTGPTQIRQVTITKGSPGTTVLTPEQPPGFTTPSNNVSLTLNVN